MTSTTHQVRVRRELKRKKRGMRRKKKLLREGTTKPAEVLFALHDDAADSK